MVQCFSAKFCGFRNNDLYGTGTKEINVLSRRLFERHNIQTVALKRKAYTYLKVLGLNSNDVIESHPQNEELRA